MHPGLGHRFQTVKTRQTTKMDKRNYMEVGGGARVSYVEGSVRTSSGEIILNRRS